LGGAYGSSTFPWSSYSSSLTWAEVDTADANSVASTGIKTMLYTNPNREAPGDPMYTSDQSTFEHDCGGARITDNYNPGIFLMDPVSGHLSTLWKNLVSSAASQGHFDAIFDDNADDLYATTARPCGDSDAVWLAQNQFEIASLSYPVIYNGLAILSPGYGISNSINLNSVSVGGMMETCYSQSGSSPKVGPAVWNATENSEIEMALQRKTMLCYSNDTSDASTSVDVRMFVFASFLLTYDPNTSVLWEYFRSPSNFHVQPESQLVALYPVLPEPGNIAGLQVGGVYAREYGACYLNGAIVGGCASIVNPDPYNSRPYPFGSKYTHTLVLSGGGILDGGSISPNGPQPPSILPPKGSIVVFR